MKLIAATWAGVFVLSSAVAFAQPVRHKSGVEIHHEYRGAARVGSGILHPNSGNPNSNADSLTGLRGTGSFNYGDSSSATGCYENCAPRDRDGCLPT
jgi:hypothetical protein